MDQLPADIRTFLLKHPSLQLTDGNKIKCTLNGHEIPCNLTELQKFTQGKKYEKLSAAAQFNYSQYEPHIVPSTKQPNQFFCKLTLRHLNRQPHHILRHVNGKRFRKALATYEECVKQGIQYVPPCLRRKKRQTTDEEVSQDVTSEHEGSQMEPPSSESEESDSDDSMSDLYPASMFVLKTEESIKCDDDKDDDDDFRTDEEEEMQVDKQEAQKRKKVQSDGFQKKFRNNQWKSGRKKHGKVKNSEK